MNSKSSKISDKLANVKAPSSGDTPVWKGPEVDGITFSLLSRFLSCRERFRLLVVEGLKPADQFNHRTQYGNMWHVCEEACAVYPGHSEIGYVPWLPALEAYTRELNKQYPTAQDQVVHWYNVCKVQFPLYVQYWNTRKTAEKRTPLLSEHVFNVPYRLPSGRIVKLRGKWDGVELVEETTTIEDIYDKLSSVSSGIWMDEHKTKGDINEQQLQQQLTFDLQTMLYLVALGRWICDKDNKESDPKEFNHPLAGVRYNVVRRPLSGGKGTIRQCKGETTKDFYDRLGRYIKEDSSHYFMRWTVNVTKEDIDKFKKQCLNPILEQLCCWWDQIAYGVTRCVPEMHSWRHPFGVYNPLDEGGSSDLDNYLESGSEAGLKRVDNLFPELG